MTKSRLLLAGLALLLAIQAVPVSRTNPPVLAPVAAPPEVVALLRRACFDCHSHETVWSAPQSFVAPASWLVARDVSEGREELNFSAWDRVDLQKIAKKLPKEVGGGDMPPWYYVVAHPDARLSEAERAVLTGWARGLAAPEGRAVTSLVLTLIGADRPGLVEAVAAAVATHGGNWLESRMAHLAGQFAGILRVEVADGEAGPLAAALEALEGRGLKVQVQPAGAEPAPGPRRALRVELEGLDRPGLVREIAQVLAERGVNIEELVTDRTIAPMSGEAIFQSRAWVLVPTSVDPEELRRRLERLAQDLMVQVNLAQPDDVG